MRRSEDLVVRCLRHPHDVFTEEDAVTLPTPTFRGQRDIVHLRRTEGKAASERRAGSHQVSDGGRWVVGPNCASTRPWCGSAKPVGLYDGQGGSKINVDPNL